VTPPAFAATCNACTLPALLGFFGLVSSPIAEMTGTSSRNIPSRFRVNSVPNTIMPVRLPPGRLRLATIPKSNRVAAEGEDDRDRRGCRLSGECRIDSPHGEDRGDVAVYQIGRKRRQLFVLIFRPTELHRDVAPGYETGLTETPVECGNVRRTGASRVAGEKSDHRQRPLLRPHRQRPCHRAEPRDELVSSAIL
jgi:hypothetical protein